MWMMPKDIALTLMRELLNAYSTRGCWAWCIASVIRSPFSYSEGLLTDDSLGHIEILSPFVASPANRDVAIWHLLGNFLVYQAQLLVIDDDDIRIRRTSFVIAPKWDEVTLGWDIVDSSSALRDALNDQTRIVLSAYLAWGNNELWGHKRHWYFFLLFSSE